jgi:hypothetical protein
MLLRCRPVPGTKTPEPEPLDDVTEQARPSPSRTAMCVVEPSLDATPRAAYSSASWCMNCSR